MKKSIALLASAALLATGVATSAQATGGAACSAGIYSDTWFCASVTLPDTVTLSRTEKVLMDITVDYTASGTFDLDTNNWVRVTSETTGVVWIFDLTPVSSTRDDLTLELGTGLATGRYTIDLYASGDVDYYDNYYGYDYEWHYIAERNIADFTVMAPATAPPAPPPAPPAPPAPPTPPPATKKAAKTYMKFSASTQKVSYNKKVKLKGSVAFGSDRKPLKSKKLTVYFDPDGDLPRKKISTVKTNSKGAFSKSFKQKVPGKWTIQLTGNPSYKKTSKSVSITAKPKKYKNCKAVNKDYRGGVARTSNAAWKGGEKHEPVVFKALYAKNKKLDRDKDGVACER